MANRWPSEFTSWAGIISDIQKRTDFGYLLPLASLAAQTEFSQWGKFVAAKPPVQMSSNLNCVFFKRCRGLCQKEKVLGQ